MLFTGSFRIRGKADDWRILTSRRVPFTDGIELQYSDHLFSECAPIRPGISLVYELYYTLQE